MTDTRKYPVAIWTREPVRKIRLRPISQETLAEVQNALSRDAKEFHGATKDGRYVVIPADNIAYFEVEELGGTLEDEES